MSAILGPQVSLLLLQQDSVATLRQLVAAGMSPEQVRAQVSAKRWRRYGSHCIVAHNAEPTRRQWIWLSVLDPPPPVALAGVTSLELAGFHYFGEETQLIHVVVRRGATYHRFPRVKVHESRRFLTQHIVWTDGLPHTPYPRSALDAAAWQPSRRYACGLLAAVVQQRIATAQQVAQALPAVGRIRHKQAMRLAILDIEGGAEALSELDIAGLCRAFGLRPPDRQRIRRDRAGRRRYLDCEWRLEDGTIIVLEVDGSHHLQVESWEADMKRERGVVISGRIVLRCTANEARWEQAGLAADLIAVGVPHG